MLRYRVRVTCLRVFVLVLSALVLLVPATIVLAEDENEWDIPEDRVLFLSGPTLYEVVRGERFVIQLFLDRTEPEDVVLTLPTLPEGIDISEVPVLISRTDGVVEARIEGVARQAGRFVIDSIMVETTTGPWFVPRILVEAAPSPGAVVPFRARWRALRVPVYQGQSIPVVLEITGIDSFTYPDGISVRTPPTGLFEEVSGIGSVFSDFVAGIELFEIPVAVFLFTPTTTGSVEIPSAEVEALGVSATAPALSLDVQPLPDAASDLGAIGSFTYSVEIDRDTLAPGETAEVRIQVIGEGNIPVLDLPSLSAEGLLLVDQSESDDVQPDTETLLGYRGTRSRAIRLEAEEGSSRGTVRIEGFSYYDPSEDRVITTPPRVFELDIPLEGTVADPGREVPDLPLLSVDDLRQLRWYRLAELQWPFFLFLLGPAIFAVARLLSVRRKAPRSRAGLVAIVLSLIVLPSATFLPGLNVHRLGRAVDLVESGEYAVAGVLYDLELQDHPNHAGLHYNRGVLAVRSDNPYAAIFHLRRAVRLAPEQRKFREASLLAREYFQLPDQLGIPFGVRPDIFILLLLALWSAFWLVLLARSALPRSISLVSMIMAAVIVGSGLAWSIHVAVRPEGIVREEVTVRRIPDNSAEPWVQLDPVTTVQIELSYEQFHLVRTGTGVTGWVPQNTVRRLGSNL